MKPIFGRAAANDGVDEGKLQAPNLSTKSQLLKLSAQHVEHPKTEPPNQSKLNPKLDNKENIPNAATDSVAKTKNPSPIKEPSVSSVDRNAVNSTQKAAESIVKPVSKPAYRKTDNIDPALMRKPGAFNQIDAKDEKCEQAKDVVNQKAVEPSKPANVEPASAKVDLPKPVKVEPPRPVKVEPRIPMTVAPPSQHVESVEPAIPTRLIKATPVPDSNAQNQSDRPAASPPQPSASVTGPWLTPVPIDGNEFVDVIVQYVAPNGVAWVSQAKHETDCNNLLRMINRTLNAASTPDPVEIKVGALFVAPFEDVYYRVVVVESDSTKDCVSVRLVDYGNDIELKIGELKTPLPPVAIANAYAFPINFKNPRAAKIGDQMKVKKEAMDGNVMLVVVDGETSMLTMQDIDVVPLPVGDSTKLVCLDHSNVKFGYISACIPDPSAVKFVEEMGASMTKYCRGVTSEHSPRANELCLVKFVDGQWYRAVTLSVIDANKFEIVFIDYGNIIIVNSSQIRKMIDDFLHPCLMNKCFIQGESQSTAQSFSQFFLFALQFHQDFQSNHRPPTFKRRQTISRAIRLSPLIRLRRSRTSTSWKLPCKAATKIFFFSFFFQFDFFEFVPFFTCDLNGK